MRDILQTADGDIDFTGDDLVLAPTERATGQHKRDILLAAPGDFKEAPRRSAWLPWNTSRTTRNSFCATSASRCRRTV